MVGPRPSPGEPGSAPGNSEIDKICQVELAFLCSLVEWTSLINQRVVYKVSSETWVLIRFLYTSLMLSYPRGTVLLMYACAILGYGWKPLFVVTWKFSKPMAGIELWSNGIRTQTYIQCSTVLAICADVQPVLALHIPAVIKRLKCPKFNITLIVV
ncbi:hypothetical protein KM043_011529 [Ampulex compressa]|nr:hypothetical protein KM043_011529 [Ampulex compressa]